MRKRQTEHLEGGQHRLYSVPVTWMDSYQMVKGATSQAGSAGSSKEKEQGDVPGTDEHCQPMEKEPEAMEAGQCECTCTCRREDLHLLMTEAEREIQGFHLCACTLCTDQTKTPGGCTIAVSPLFQYCDDCSDGHVQLGR